MNFEESAMHLQDYADGLPEVVRGSLEHARRAAQADTPYLQQSLVTQAAMELQGIKTSIDHLILFYNRVCESLGLEKPYPNFSNEE
jgi:hypothetical protein